MISKAVYGEILNSKRLHIYALKYITTSAAMWKITIVKYKEIITYLNEKEFFLFLCFFKTILHIFE